MESVVLNQAINQYFNVNHYQWCIILKENISLSFGEQCISESLDRLTNKQKGVENYCCLSCAARANVGSAAKRSKSHRKGSRVQSTDETSPRFMCTVKTCSSFLKLPLFFVPFCRCLMCIIWMAYLFSLPSHVSSSWVSLSLSLVQDWVGGNNGDVCFLETSSEDADVWRLHKHAETARYAEMFLTCLLE